MAFVLTSTAFREGERIPAKHTCQGQDLPPPLAWSGPPPGTKAYAMVMTDNDAPRGPWTHWTWWDLPVTTLAIPEGVEVARMGARLGMTSSLTTEYHGPCPPQGVHRYVFTLHALAQPLGLPEGAAIVDVNRALLAKSMATTELMGTYGMV